MQGAEYGQANSAIERAELNKARFVELRYARDDGKAQFVLSAFQDPGRELRPVDGGGEARRSKIAGRETIIQTRKDADGLGTSLLAAWQEEEVAVLLHAFLHDPRVVTSNVSDRGFTEEELLALIAKIR